MSTSDDIRADLVAYLHEELPDEREAEIVRRAGEDPELAAELELLRTVLGLTRAGTEIEPGAAETERLFDAVDAELERAQPRAPVLRLWNAAVRRYEHSSRFRRVTLASLGMHAAAAAVVAWVLISAAGPGKRKIEFGVEFEKEMAQLEDPKPALTDDDGGATIIDETDLVAVQDHPFVDADVAEGVRLPDVMEPRSLRSHGERLRFPTRAIMAHISIAIDPEQRAERMRTAVDELAPRADASVQRGLTWLASQRGEDGRWGPVPAAGAEDFRDGVTAACVLSYVQSGHSAVSGEYADLLSPAIDALERRLRTGPAKSDPKPVYSHALALRALTWEWAADFGELSREQRAARLELLAAAGKRLIEWQRPDGGFGYRPADERSDSSCTLFATAALADLRLAGVMRPDDALALAGRYIEARRSRMGGLGYQKQGDRLDDLALTAGMLAYAPELKLGAGVGPALKALERRLGAKGDRDALLAWSGLQALRRHRRPLTGALRRVLAQQRDDGSWPAATDRHCRLGGDSLTTALGVLSVTRVYMP